MMPARALQACDAVVTLLNETWTEKGADDGAQRGYVPRIALTQDANTPHKGRKLYVFPSPYKATLLTRGDQWREYTIRVLMVERYCGEENTPPDAWVDERVSFFEQNVFNVLANQELVLLDQMQPSLEDTATVDVLYSDDMLLQHQTFWSFGSFPFAEDTDLSGGVSL